jgi:hypothetical protein
MMSIQLVDEKLIHQIKEIAAQEQRLPEQIVSDALKMYLARHRKVPGISFLLSISGQSESDEDDISERDEEILANEVDSIHGWSVGEASEDSA